MLGSMAYDYLSKKHNVIELNDRISESNVFQIISKINNLNPKYMLIVLEQSRKSNLIIKICIF